jgi:CSLREA domain-containing protein
MHCGGRFDRPTVIPSIALLALLIATTGRTSLAQNCSSAPGDVIDLQFAADGMTMTFTEPLVTGGGVPLFDMLRADGMAQFASTAVCVESNDLDNAAVDGANPALGQMFVYIPRAENDCGLGVMGYDDAGVERPQGIQCGLCLTDATCDDGLYCSGNETCDVAGACQAGTPPACAPFACDEGAAACVVSCADDAGCASGFGCAAGSCVEAIDVTVMEDGRDADPGDGACDTGGGDCTLRAAIQEANARAGLQIVRLGEGAYLLTLNGMSDDEGLSGDFDLLEDVIVRGGDSARTWVDGQTVDRVFHVHPGVAATLANLTVQQGMVMGGDGGGVLNEGMLQVERAMVNVCSADGRGGGIFNAPLATLTLNGSTVAFNNAGDDGGGVANDGDLTAIITTLSNNTAADRGGALQLGPRGTAELINVTVYNNSAATGGGLDPGAGTLQMVNTVVAGSIMGGDCAAPPLSLGHNLAGDLSCDLTETGDLQETDPQLADLRNYVDSGVLTHFPLEPSRLLGMGDPSVIPPLDQNLQNWAAHGTFAGAVVPLPLVDALGSGRVYVNDGTQIRVLETLAHMQVGMIPIETGKRMVMHPSGTRMYASFTESNGNHRIDMLNLNANLYMSSLYTPWDADLVMHPSGTTLFAAGGDILGCQIWAIDTATLAVIGVRNTLGCMFDFAVQSNGGALLGGPNSLFGLPVSPYAFSADALMTSETTSPWPGSWMPHGIRTGPSGTYFTEDRTLNDLAGLAPKQSRLSFVSWFSAPPLPLIDLPVGPTIVDFVSNPLGTLVYAGYDDGLIVINTNPGQVIGGVPDVGDASIAIHPLGGAVYIVDGQFNAISTTTLGVIASEPFGTEGVAVKP